MPKDIASPIIAGEAAVLGRRYAGALFELAAEQKQLDSVASDLRSLRILRQESSEFQFISAHPRLTRKQLVKSVGEVAKAIGLSPLTTNFVSLVAQNRRLGLLGAIIDAFLADLAQRRGEFTADVTSARALSPVQEEQLAAKLGTWVGGKVHLSVRKDPGLLGGLTVKMGSRLIDASVKTRLAKLERQLKLESNAPQKGAA